jgi:hypothetical protein
VFIWYIFLVLVSRTKKNLATLFGNEINFRYFNFRSLHAAMINIQKKIEFPLIMYCTRVARCVPRNQSYGRELQRRRCKNLQRREQPSAF